MGRRILNLLLILNSVFCRMKDLLPLCGVFLLLLSSCTKDRVDQLTNKGTSPGDVTIQKGVLVINEILSTGSPDWIEIYNPNNQRVKLEGGKWFITDNLGNAEKFQLPDTAIKANGYLLIPCDGTGAQGATISTNFSLSSSGEEAGLFYKLGSLVTAIDTVTFPALPSGTSFGRQPNGTGSFKTLSKQSPEASND